MVELDLELTGILSSYNLIIQVILEDGTNISIGDSNPVKSTLVKPT